MNTLKEINGKYYQEAEVVMITTDKFTLTTLCKCIRVNGLLMDALKLNHLSKPLTKEELKDANHGKDVIGIDRYFEAQNIYILSKEKINIGDWRLDIFMDNPVPKQSDIECGPELTRKIIATTDKSLKIESELDAYYRNGIGGARNLPQPSDSFIQEYIKEYNQGNQIKKMLVEYCQIEYEPIFASMEKATDVQLRIDSGNVITLKKIEPETYTREEV